MNKNINVCLQTYKQAVKNYFIWVDTLKRSYGWAPGREFDNFNLSTKDYNSTLQENAKLQGMANVLGLTKKEILKIDKEMEI
jgi:hypothetical protein